VLIRVSQSLIRRRRIIRGQFLRVLAPLREIFKLNVKAFPEAFNPYDSLGEAYMLAGEKELAIKNYRKSIEINPDNENGRKMLEKLKK